MSGDTTLPSAPPLHSVRPQPPPPIEPLASFVREYPLPSPWPSFVSILCLLLGPRSLFGVGLLEFLRHLMVKLLTVRSKWDGLGEVPGEDFTETPRVVKRMQIDEVLAMSRVRHLSSHLCWLTALCVANLTDFAAAPAVFAVMLGIENK